MSQQVELVLDVEVAGSSAEPTAVQRGGVDATPISQDKTSLIRQERRLVERCVKGDVAAWETLYETHHPALLRSIAALLGPNASDRSLVDELAAQVWYRLVDKDGQLLGRFSPKRGARLNTFIRAVAKEVMCRHFRSEQRRRRRELVAAQNAKNSDVNECRFDESLSEFLGTLTEREREFAESYLLSDGGEGKEAVASYRSEANIWQLSRRIRLRLKKFFRAS